MSLDKSEQQEGIPDSSVLQRSLQRSKWDKLRAQEQLLTSSVTQLPRRGYLSLWTPSSICWREKCWVTVTSATHSRPAGKKVCSPDHTKRQYLCPTSANTMLTFSFSVQLGRSTANAMCICRQGHRKLFAGEVRALDNSSGLPSLIPQVAGWLMTCERG